MSNKNSQNEAPKGHSNNAHRSFLARRRAQLTALVGSLLARRPDFVKQRSPSKPKTAVLVAALALGGTFAFVSAIGSSESSDIAVCNQATQVNTVCTSSNALTLKPPAAPGNWWHTSGTQILDSGNNVVHLRGADDGRMVQVIPGTLPASEFSNLNSWGFNFIRLGISWANLEPSAPTISGGTLNHTWSPTYLASIDSVVQQAKANNLRIVLDFHQVNWSPKFSGTGMPSWLFPSNPTEGTAKCEFMTNTVEPGSPESQQAGLTIAETMIAQRYLNDSTVVGIDMFNEPQSCNYNGKQTYFVPTGGTPYDDFYHNVSTALHNVNSNLLLIYEDDAYQSYLKQSFAVTRGLDVPNGIYSSHMYPDAWSAGNTGNTCQIVTSVTGQQFYSAHLAKANSWNQPLYIGEFDGFHLAANACAALPNASNDLLTLMSSAKNDGVNWSLWEYDRAGQSMIDSSGNPKQPLISDLQTGLDGPTPPPQPENGSESGSVTLCHAGSTNFNSWNSIAANASIPGGTTVSLKFATASGDCNAPTNQSAFSAPVTISDSGSSGGTDPHQLDGLNLADSKVLLIEADLYTADSSIVPALNSLTLTDTPVNQPPSVPTGLNGTSSVNSVNLSWSASSDDNDAQSMLIYKVYRGGIFLTQTAAGVTSYTNTGLSSNTSYTYTVSACDTQGNCSTPSAPLTARTQTDTTPPTIPTNIAIAVGRTSAIISWSASTDNVSFQAQIFYKVYRNGSLRATTAPGKLTYTDSSLKTNTQYTYKLAACDAAGNCSAKSAGKTITTPRR